MLAVILESGEPTRLYTGLSLLVSTAAEGEPARALLSFGALDGWGREVPGPLGATLRELWATATELCTLQVCAAAARANGPAFDGVISMPRWLRETAGARLVVV
jgi:hypothetical protein